MTAIVGITDGNTVYIGGDRAAADNDTILSTVKAKVGMREPIVYGYAGTYGIGQLIEVIDLPPLEGDPFIYIRTIIVEELKKAIDKYARDTPDNITLWLIGCEGHLYEISSDDWGVVEVYETAIGTGGTFCLGSLYTSMLSAVPIEERIQLALQSAIAYSPSCLGPYDIVHI